MRNAAQRLCVVLLPLFTACISSSEFGALNVDGGSDTAAEAECFVPGYANPPFSCALPEPCAQVIYFDPAYSSPGNTGPPTIDLAAARCVLEHIRDDIPSYLTVHQDLFLGFSDELIWVQGDGSAILRRHYRYDLYDGPKLPRRFRRKETAFFDTCLQQTDPKTVHACLISWWVSDQICYPADSLPCNP